MSASPLRHFSFISVHHSCQRVWPLLQTTRALSCCLSVKVHLLSSTFTTRAGGQTLDPRGFLTRSLRVSLMCDAAHDKHVWGPEGFWCAHPIRAPGACHDATLTLYQLTVTLIRCQLNQDFPRRAGSSAVCACVPSCLRCVVCTSFHWLTHEAGCLDLLSVDVLSEFLPCP